MAQNKYCGEVQFISSSFSIPRVPNSCLSMPNLFWNTYCSHMVDNATADMLLGRYIADRQKRFPFTPDARMTAKNSATDKVRIPPINHILPIFLRDARKTLFLNSSV